MSESFVQITEGSGKKLHTKQRTIGANTVEDEIVVLGEPYLATYVVPFTAIAVTPSTTHLVQIMAGASLKVYLRRIHIVQHTPGAWTGAGNLVIQLVRLTTAGTGGGAATIAALDSSDPAAGATARTVVDASKGTEGAILHVFNVNTTKVTSAESPPATDLHFGLPGAKSLVIPAGASNGLALKLANADATGTVNGFVEFSEANF